jgi:hypothetical protein
LRIGSSLTNLEKRFLQRLQMVADMIPAVALCLSATAAAFAILGRRAGFSDESRP